MVMITISRRASEGCNNSDVSSNKMIPPWCSSGRLIKRRERHKAPKPDWEMRSLYPNRENIWEYLQDKETRDFHCIREKSTKNHRRKHARGKTFLKFLIFFLLTAAVTMSFWKYDSISGRELKAKVTTKTGFISLLGMDSEGSVAWECCLQMAHLAQELSRTRQALRSSSRMRRTLLLMPRSIPEYTHVESIPREGHILEAKAFKGGSTAEWGGRLFLWGLVPLWRAAPPPDTVLSMRPPTPSDCWPFSGSLGEVVIELSHKANLEYVSLEHVRPDTARSAPKEFVVHSILENDTRLEIARGTYTYKKAAKQYFPSNTRDFPVKRVAFKVLSNQGNRKYTCIYRVHLYGSELYARTIVL